MTPTELLGAAIGSTMLALGGAAILAWALPRRRPDRVLLLFGLWCGVYGARLMAEQPVITATIGGPDLVWAYFRAFATYAINVPIGLFLEALIGRGWKASVRRVWQVQAVYAVAAIATDLVLARPRAAMPLNSPMIVVALIIALPNIWMFRDRLSPTFKSPVIGAGAAALLVSVLNENLGRPVAPTVHLEPVGVFAFVVALGYGVVGSVFRREAEFLAVQRELETARRIQTGLLPRTVPNTRGLQLAARHVPMTAVAGDLYDFVPLGPSRTGILVADVSGHGVPAALVASMVKLAFTTQAEHADPARVLTSMNRMLCQQGESTFVTAIYAVVDTHRLSMTVANAGHPSLLIGRSDHSVRESTGRGLMLGLSPDASYENESFDLASGDRILLYTDGIPEAQSAAGEFLDVGRITGWLASPNAEDAGAFADSVLRNLHRWRGTSSFEDDVTFVIARVGRTLV